MNTDETAEMNRNVTLLGFPFVSLAWLLQEDGSSCRGEVDPTTEASIDCCDMLHGSCRSLVY